MLHPTDNFSKTFGKFISGFFVQNGFDKMLLTSTAIRKLDAVDIASASAKRRPGFESRQGISF
jgi:hypothetical protein